MTRSLDLGTPGGLTVAVKECLAIEGLPTRAGSAAFEDAPAATAHATVVTQLISSGCHLTGRANMHELAFGMTGANAHCGTPLNPNWPDRIPGGSSSGSAVLVAAGEVEFAVGTDTGGSVRQPAACCGVYGLKPTFGRISRAGALPVGSSLDCIGPFARNTEMLARAMEAMDPTFTALPARMGRLAAVTVTADAEVAEAFRKATGTLAVAQPVTLPHLEDAFHAGMTVISAELATEFGALVLSNATLGADVRARILKGCEVTTADLAEAEAIRAVFTAEVDAALETVDALLLPTLPSVPPTWDQAEDPAAIPPLTRFVRPFNLSGHPALTIPILTDAGLPAGLQLVARKGADALLCALARGIDEILREDSQ
ncbi:amidase [Chachezhania antarctica]|uniref:amidase n=1 Tax=Chachezhania antarctica TaxID=2340860 RepID=UPI001F08A7FC|nr:amidase [Chachezhania antarctica]